jgi:hypothetical protein
MPAYDNNKPQQSRINFFDLAGRTINLFEQEPLNAFDSIDAILLDTEEPLEAYFWDEPQAVSPWNSYWTEAAANGGGLSINDPVFKDSWTKYFGLHVNCEDEDICYCEHNCGGTHTTKGRAVTNSDKERSAQDFILYPTASTTPSWSQYEARKLEKGKAVDHRKPGENLSWISGVPPLIIVTTPEKHDIFLW